MNDILNDLIIYLGAKCALCHKDYPDKKSWTIHHRRYRCGDCGKVISYRAKTCPFCGGTPEKTRKSFARNERIQYYIFLNPIVLKRPKDFAPLHNSCHHSLRGGSRWGKKSGNRQRYCKLIMEL